MLDICLEQKYPSHQALRRTSYEMRETYKYFKQLDKRDERRTIEMIIKNNGFQNKE